MSCYRVRGGGNMVFGLGLPQAHSSIYLILLWLATLKRPSRVERGRKAVLIYPWGKAQNSPPRPVCPIPSTAAPLSPRPGFISDRSSPSRVRFAASRPGLLRADPRGDAVHEGKGGGGPWGARTGCQALVKCGDLLLCGRIVHRYSFCLSILLF